MDVPTVFKVVVFLIDPKNIDRRRGLPVGPVFARRDGIDFVDCVMVFSVFSTSALDNLSRRIRPGRNQLFETVTPRRSVVRAVTRSTTTQGMSRAICVSAAFLASLGGSSLQGVLTFSCRPRTSPREHGG